MKVSGEREGLGFLLAELGDAIVLGGTLIMLPEDQIEEQRAASQFEGEVADSYGEIANIISGSLTQVFLDRYPKQLRFIKTDTETIVPTKIDPASESPFPEGQYYLATFAIHMEDYELHRLHLLFPAEVFDLDSSTAEASGQPAAAAAAGAKVEKSAVSSNAPEPGEWGAPAAADASAPPGEGQPAQAQAGSAATQVEKATGPPIVLLMSDRQEDTEPFKEILTSAGYECRVMNYQDEVKTLFQQHKILEFS